MLERRGSFAFDYDLHGGTAPVRMQWLFHNQSTLPVAVQVWELPPGGSEGMHAHPADSCPLEELYIVIEGTARMHLDGERHDLAAGDALLAPVGSEHDLANTGMSKLRVLVVWGEPGVADYSSFGSFAAAQAARNGDAGPSAGRAGTAAGADAQACRDI
ncbi:cupin domain-containing protein [Arthrobacter crystallopoietes BAB-32]|uniref:Cupin domain-containing protein n=1 Tax=Arthrobacter crystallopoietes BAB-32 TaxID=1246476 RepID=N1V7W4_9MICC|nr:cupin domain-containing protein [Arthrobacter crystallopoietes]EMY36202.1 cupin domain-containing protein [Arthrobacter crystallopoietes BAB-32]